MPFLSTSLTHNSPAPRDFSLCLSVSFVHVPCSLMPRV